MLAHLIFNLLANIRKVSIKASMLNEEPNVFLIKRTVARNLRKLLSLRLPHSAGISEAASLYLPQRGGRLVGTSTSQFSFGCLIEVHHCGCIVKAAS